MIDNRILPQGMIYKPFPQVRNTQQQSPNKSREIRRPFPGQTFPRSKGAQEAGHSLASAIKPQVAEGSSLRSTLNETRSTLQSISQAARFQREADKTQGVGLLQGAKAFSSTLETGRAAQSFDMETIGQNGRNELLQSFGTELQTWADNFSKDKVAPASNTSITENSGAASDEATSQRVSGAATVASASGGGLLPLAGAVYSGYNLISNWGKADVATGAVNGAAVGAYIGSVIPGVGTLIGGVLGGLIGASSALFGRSGKDQDQLQRDSMRSRLQEMGLLDQKFGIELADGSRYDLGKDGGFTLPNLDGSSRHSYDTDPANPLSGIAIGLLNPLAYLLTGGDPKAQSDLVGLLANAAMSNAHTVEELRQNILHFVERFGLGEDQLKNALTASFAMNKQDNTLAAYENGVSTLFHPELLAEQVQGSPISSKDEEPQLPMATT